jgi:hypothetical protein
MFGILDGAEILMLPTQRKPSVTVFPLAGGGPLLPLYGDRPVHRPHLADAVLSEQSGAEPGDHVQRWAGRLFGAELGTGLMQTLSGCASRSTQT